MDSVPCVPPYVVSPPVQAAEQELEGAIGTLRGAPECFQGSLVVLVGWFVVDHTAQAGGAQAETSCKYMVPMLQETNPQAQAQALEVCAIMKFKLCVGTGLYVENVEEKSPPCESRLTLLLQNLELFLKHKASGKLNGAQVRTASSHPPPPLNDAVTLTASCFLSFLLPSRSWVQVDVQELIQALLDNVVGRAASAKKGQSNLLLACKV
jgi:hypothetical protein